MYVLSDMPRDLIDPLTRPGVREPADDFDSEEMPLRLDTGLAESYDCSFPDESAFCRREKRWNGDMWSSSLSDTPISRGTELVSDSDVWIVVAECADLLACSSMEFGGDGGSSITGCWTLATIMDGELRSNCCTVPFGPSVNNVAPGPYTANPLTCSSVGIESNVTCFVRTSHEIVSLG